MTLPQALPPLTKARFAIFCLCWMAALAVAVIVPLGGAFALHQERARTERPFLEFDLPHARASSGDLQLLTPWGEQAKQSGVTAGDTILKVNGRPVPRSFDRRAEIAALLRDAPGPTVTIQTLSRDGQVRTHQLARTRAADVAYGKAGVDRSAPQIAGTTAYLLSVAFMITAAVMLFRRRARDPVAALLSLSFLLLTCFGLHGYAFFAALGAPWMNSVLISIGWIAQFLALMTFPQGRFEPRWTLLILPVLVIWAVLLPLRMLPDAVENFGGLAVGLSCLAAMLVRYRRLSPGMQRQQIRWTLFGVTCGACVAAVWVTAAAVAPMATDDAQRIWLSLLVAVLTPISFSLPPLGLLISLLRYRLYDADAVISRSAGYAVLTLVLGAIFAGSAEAMEGLLESNFPGDAGALPGAMGAGLTMLLITPLHKRIEAWVEGRFQKALLHLRRDLPERLVHDRQTDSLEQLLETLLSELASGVRASHAAVLLCEDGVSRIAAARGVDEHDAAAWAAAWAPQTGAGALDCDSADPLFPLRVPLALPSPTVSETLGWVLLGPRPDGSFYGKDEREALAHIAGPIARAVHVVTRRERRERAIRARAEEQEQRVAALEQMLQALTPGSAARLRSIGGGP